MLKFIIGFVVVGALAYVVSIGIAMVSIFSAASSIERFRGLENFDRPVELVERGSMLARLSPTPTPGMAAVPLEPTEGLSTLEQMERLSRGADAGDANISGSGVEIDTEIGSFESWLPPPIVEDED